MTIAQRIGRAADDLDIRRRSREFTRMAMIFAEAKGGFNTALHIAESSRAVPGIIETLKAGVPALAPYQQRAGAFVASMQEFSAFDQILAVPDAFKRAPMHTWVVMSTSVATASEVSEGGPKPVTSWQLGREQLLEKKVMAQAVTTNELRKFSPATAHSNIDFGLKQAVAVGTDTVFVDTSKTSLVSRATPARE